MRTATTAPIAVQGLSKVYGSQRAVDDLTFELGWGKVTGFLGPNGAGKTTTLKMLLGLARPTAGEALVLGRRYQDLDRPAAHVGALVDVSGFHPARTGRRELRILAAAAEVADERVDVVLDQVGLTDAAGKRIGQYSLGMRQRLGLAAALLGEPSVLILDEPANGLDPAGHHWLRTVLRQYADAGHAVLVSSHVLAELAQLADDVVVVNHGRLVTQQSIETLVSSPADVVHVRTPEPDGDRLVRAVVAAGASVNRPGAGELTVIGLRAESVGQLALENGVVLHQLHTESQTLERVFLDLTDDKEAIR